MTGGYLQAALFMTNRSEPIRQSSLLMVLAGGIGQGTSLLTGLDALAKESSPPWSGQVGQLRVLLEHGTTLSDALTSVPDLLPEETRISIRVAEKTGTLRQVLTDEAHRLMNPPGHGTPVSRSLPGALLWLCVIGVVTSSIVSFQMIFILPKFKTIFYDFGTDLPAMTTLLIDAAGWATEYWYLVYIPIVSVLIISGGFGFWSHYQHVSRGRRLLTEHIPRYWVPLLLRMMSITVAAGDSLRETLHHILSELRPGLASTRISALRQAVDSGEDCFEAMQRLNLLRNRETAFLKSAARTSHADWGLRHLAVNMERRRQVWIHRVVNAILPVMIILMGIAVGFVCIALFLPILKLINDLS